MTNSNTVTSIANTSELRDYIRRIENLEQEKRERADDIKEVYGEAKNSGFDTKIMRKIVRLRRMNDAERTEEETLLDLYMEALGMKLEVT